MAEGNHSLNDTIHKILIVDDESDVLNALLSTLHYTELFQSEITTADSAENALNLLEKNEFDLVLVDYYLPGMDGLELLQIVKDKYPKISRILILGNAELELAKQAVNNNDINYYIEKPWDKRDLEAIIVNALEKKVKIENIDIISSKQRILDYLMGIYNDAKNMGLDLSSMDDNIKNAKVALEDSDWQKALTYINQTINSIMNLADSSMPELKVKKTENVQFQFDKWNQMNLEITNNGKVHANEIKFSVKGEFDVKEVTTIPRIMVNETKNVSVEVFPRQKGIIPLEIRLTYKKMFDNTEYGFQDKLWIQIGDLVGKTKLKRKFGYHDGYIKMELDIINEDIRDIKDVNLELIYDENILLLSYIKPIYSKLSKKFKMGDIRSRDGKNILIYFDPQICTNTFIGGGISYKDWQDNEKYIMLSPQKVRIFCPTLFTKDRINLTELDQLLRDEFIYTGNKIINIPLGLNMKDALRTCKELIYKYNTTFIQEFIEPNPYTVEAWFYGTSEDLRYKFTIKFRIDEDTNSIELFIASSNKAALTGLLTDLLWNLNQYLENKGIIMQPLRQIDNIALKENLILSKKSLLYKQFEVYNTDFQTDLAQKIRNASAPLADKFERISRAEQFNLSKRREVISKLD